MATTIMRPFYGLGESAKVAATTLSQNVELPTEAGSLYKLATIRLFNAAASVAFFRTGSVTVSATPDDSFLAPGSTEIFVLPNNHTHVAIVLEAGTGPVYVQRGGGV